MSEFTITLSLSLDDALELLTQRARIDQDDETLTAQEHLQTLVEQALYAAELEIETTMQLLMVAGYQLPSCLRTRMTDTLTVEQLVLLAHMAPPPLPPP